MELVNNRNVHNFAAFPTEDPEVVEVAFCRKCIDFLIQAIMDAVQCIFKFFGCAASNVIKK